MEQMKTADPHKYWCSECLKNPETEGRLIKNPYYSKYRSDNRPEYIIRRVCTPCGTWRVFVPIKIQNSGKRSIAIGTALIVFALITRMVDSTEYRIELMSAFIFPIVAAVPFLLWGAGRFYAYRRWKRTGIYTDVS